MNIVPLLFRTVMPLLLAAATPAVAVQAAPEAPATLRVDVLHTGNALDEHYALERVVLEPLP
jgi:hypothetical protein